MKRTHNHLIGWMTLGCGVILAASVWLGGQEGQEAGGVGGLGEDSALDLKERQVDRGHFQKIYEAIQAYRKDHNNDVPNWLSDLVPQYLADTNCLLSPTHQRTGEVGPYFIPDPKLPTSYNYEFNSTPSSRFIEGETDAGTMKDWKKKQMEIFGDTVPLVRYLHPNGNYALNLSWSGAVFDTQISWETHTNTLALVKKQIAEGRLKAYPSQSDLVVTVVDGVTQKAIPEAELKAETSTDRGWFPVFIARTDGQGQCRIPVPKTKVSLVNIEAKASGYLVLIQTVRNAGYPGEMTLPLNHTMALAKGGRISGFVRAVDGKPIAGVAVVIPSSSFRVETDAQGRWTLDNLPVGYRNMSVTITHPDFRTERVVISTDTIQTVLEPRLVVKGTLADMETGKPIRKFFVAAGTDFHRGVRWSPRKGVDNLKGQFSLKYDREVPDYLMFDAEGYEPVYTDCLSATTPAQSLEIKLRKAKPLVGKVELPGGNAASGAQVQALDQFSQASVGGGKLLSAHHTTDSEGRFIVAASSQAYGLAVAHQAGYAEITVDEFQRAGKVVLKPWNTVKGLIEFSVLQPFPSLALLTRDFTLAQTFQGPYQGRTVWDFNSFVREGIIAGQTFEFEQVVPGGGVFWKANYLDLNSTWSEENMSFNGVHFVPGEDSTVTLNCEKGYRLKSRLRSPKPLAWNSLIGFFRIKEEGSASSSPGEIAFTFAPEGYFCVDGLPSNLKAAELRIYQPPVLIGTCELSGLEGKLDNKGRKQWQIETLEMTLVPSVKVGGPAPDIELPALASGGRCRLADFRGRYVLLDFWASWSQPGFASADPLKKIIQEFPGDRQLVVWGINLGDPPALRQRCIDVFGMNWTQQALAGEWWQTDLPARFGAESIPAAFLISPDGRLLEGNIARNDLPAVVRKHLKK
jgi:hypothetical protein